MQTLKTNWIFYFYFFGLKNKIIREHKKRGKVRNEDETRDNNEKDMIKNQTKPNGNEKFNKVYVTVQQLNLK